jgi:putative transposase
MLTTPNTIALQCRTQPFTARLHSEQRDGIYMIGRNPLLVACSNVRQKPCMANASGHQALREGRVSLPGQIYLLTTVTERRIAHFTDTELARTACRTMLARRVWGDAHALCWVLMPDHWHGLIELGDHDDLSVVMNRLKSLLSKAVRPLAPTSFRWARGFHDHALRRDEDLLAAARYIVANPVRAGLVTNVNDYPYWNSAWL